MLLKLMGLGFFLRAPKTLRAYLLQAGTTRVLKTRKGPGHINSSHIWQASKANVVGLFLQVTKDPEI